MNNNSPHPFIEGVTVFPHFWSRGASSVQIEQITPLISAMSWSFADRVQRYEKIVNNKTKYTKFILYCDV